MSPVIRNDAVKKGIVYESSLCNGEEKLPLCPIVPSYLPGTWHKQSLLVNLEWDQRKTLVVIFGCSTLHVNFSPLSTHKRANVVNVRQAGSETFRLCFCVCTWAERRVSTPHNTRVLFALFCLRPFRMFFALKSQQASQLWYLVCSGAVLVVSHWCCENLLVTHS